MSTRSKIVLGMSCIISASIILGVHYKQQLDKEKMHQGVLRDQALQEMKRRQNLFELDQQTALTKVLREQEQAKKSSV